jgi:hypothetical protein
MQRVFVDLVSAAGAGRQPQFLVAVLEQVFRGEYFELAHQRTPNHRACAIGCNHPTQRTFFESSRHLVA